MSKKSKTGKIITGVITGVLIVGAIIGGIVYAQTASAHNQKVDAVANEINDNLSALTMDLTQDTIDTPTAFKYLVELSLLDNGQGINEAALTYYDGSKNKYNEVNDNVDATIDAYQNYFKNKNENVLTQAAIDVAAATKAELTACIDSLNQLLTDLDTQNMAAKVVDSEWGIIFGDDAATAEAYFNDLRTRVVNKLNELQAQLDSLNATEAQAAAQAAAAAASASSSSSSSNKSSSSSNYSNSGSSGNSSGGGSSQGGSVSPEYFQQLQVMYWNYFRAEMAAGRTPMSFSEWRIANGY